MTEQSSKKPWTEGAEIRDYGSPVELTAAECQFAILDGPDGAPVAYVYRQEDASLYAAAPDMAEALLAILSGPAIESIPDNDVQALILAALAKAGASQ